MKALFDINVWRKNYDEIAEMSHVLRDSRPTANDYGRFIPALSPLSLDSQRDVERSIRKMLIDVSKYLDKCGIAVRNSKRNKF